MKTTKAGLTIIEDNDKTPGGYDAFSEIWATLDMFRKEHNKTAELIDSLQNQIDELKSHTKSEKI